jgi:hypothetical protein
MNDSDIDAILNGAQETTDDPGEVTTEEKVDTKSSEELAEELAEQKKQNEELRKAYNKRDEEVREARELKERLKGSKEKSEDLDIDKGNADYLKSLGFVSKDELDKQKEIDRLATEVRKQMSKATEEYKFINSDELYAFMKEKRLTTAVTVEEAARIKYKDEFSLLATKGTYNPIESDKGGSRPVGNNSKPKYITFADRSATSRSISETLSNAGIVS